MFKCVYLFIYIYIYIYLFISKVRIYCEISPNKYVVLLVLVYLQGFSLCCTRLQVNKMFQNSLYLQLFIYIYIYIYIYIHSPIYIYIYICIYTYIVLDR